jgi:hypothetical protein
MNSLEFVTFERATGRVVSVLTCPPDQLDCNVPEGCSAGLIDLPPGCLYVCPLTLQPQPERLPPAPEPGCTWDAQANTWRTPAYMALQHNRGLQRAIEQLEAAQARPLREVQLAALGLLPEAEAQAARARLAQLHTQIAELRAQRVAVPESAPASTPTQTQPAEPESPPND